MANAEEIGLMSITRAEHSKLKRRLERTESKVRENREKMKQMKRLFECILRNPTKINKIRLTVPATVVQSIVRKNKSMDNLVCSEPLEIAGFQWKLEAYRRERSYDPDLRHAITRGNNFAFCLAVYPPDSYQGPFEFEVNCHLLLLHSSDSPDQHLHKGANGLIKRENFDQGGIVLWECGWGKSSFDPKLGFFHADGSIQVEVDFVIQNARLYPDDEDEENNQFGD